MSPASLVSAACAIFLSAGALRAVEAFPNAASCVVPTAEKSVFHGWESNDSSSYTALFAGFLSGNRTKLAGRQVTEGGSGSGTDAKDSCHCNGSPFPR